MANLTLQKQMELKSQKNKSHPVLPPISPQNNLNQTEKNLSKVLVITKNDLDRITGHLNKKQREEDAALEEYQRKKELHEKSLALTRNWNNTIEGSRRHKLQQKKIREEKLEEKRRAVDLEHAQFMAQERKKALEQAKLLQYHETDRIKTFHSALKYSEVLKEREAQLEMKKLIDQMNKDADLEREREILALQDDKAKIDEEKYIKKKEEIAKLTEYHKQQIKEHMVKIKAQKDEVSKEAEELDRLNEQFAFEKEQIEQIRRKRIKELKDTYDLALENKKKIQEAEKIMDEEENDEIRAYAAAKKKLAILKRRKEDEILKEKEDNREKMLSYIGSLMKEEVADEEFRIAKAVARQEARLAAEEQFKEEKFRREIGEIHKHRIDTIKRKEMEKIAREKEEAESMKKKIETDILWQIYETQKGKQAQEKSNANAKTNLKMAKDRKEIEKQVVFADRDFVIKEMDLMKLEDKQFEDYANNVINYMEHHGRNTYPMKKVVGDTLKKGQQADTQAAAIKKHQQDVPTKRNLGFGMN